MPRGHEEGRLSRGLEYLGGGWVDRYVPEKMEMSADVGFVTKTRGLHTKTLKSGKKTTKKKRTGADRSVVLLVVGLAFVFMALIWILFFLCLLIDEQSMADKVLLLAVGITPSVFTAMFSAAGVRFEFLKPS